MSHCYQATSASLVCLDSSITPEEIKISKIQISEILFLLLLSEGKRRLKDFCDTVCFLANDFHEMLLNILAFGPLRTAEKKPINDAKALTFWLFQAIKFVKAEGIQQWKVKHSV